MSDHDNTSCNVANCFVCNTPQGDHDKLTELEGLILMELSAIFQTLADWFVRIAALGLVIGMLWRRGNRDILARHYDKKEQGK